MERKELIETLQGNWRLEMDGVVLYADLAKAERIPELIASMRKIEGALGGERPQTSLCLLRPHRVGDMGWVVYSESVGYAEQYGWDSSFEALVARIVGEFLTNFDADRERCWIAELDRRRAGHVFLVKHPDEPDTAKLRLLYVDPPARGMGLGQTLVRECVQFARTAGYRRIVLWTQCSLTSAHRIYEGAGFRLVKETPHRSFGKDLVAQDWELVLTGA